MAQLDVGLMTPTTQYDPAGAQAKAYSLKDLMQTSQLNDIKLKKEQKELQEDEQVKSALKGVDTTSEEGRISALSKVRDINPVKAMQLQRQFSEAKTANIEQERADIQLSLERMRPLASASEAIVSAYENAKARGLQGDQLNMAVAPIIAQQMKTVMNLKGSDGKPVVPQQVLQQIAQQMQQPVDKFVEGVRGFATQAPDHIKNLEMGLEERRIKDTEKKESREAAGQKFQQGQEERRTRALESKSGVPAGYERDPDKKDQLRPIKGGPKDPAMKGQVDIASRMNPTMLASVKLDIKEIKNGLENMRKATTDTTGAFFEQEHAGVFKAILGRSITPESKQQYEVYANRLAVAIASVQSMGRGQISDSKVNEARKLVPQPGDKPKTIETKLSMIEKISNQAEEVLSQKGPAPEEGTAPTVEQQVEDFSQLWGGNK